MSKTIQFRCPKDKRHLFSWETGSDQLIFKAEGLRFIDIAGSKKKDVVCAKCNTRLEITKQGLQEVVLIEK